MKPNKFWVIKAKKDNPEVGELTLYGDISSVSWWGDEVTPKQFKADLDALGDIKNLDIYVNSGGGEVFAGMAIYNIIKRHKAYKTAYIDGIAASIASVIIMAADKRVIPENAMIMIHNCCTFAMGNKIELRKIADDLEKVDQSILGTYIEKTGKTCEEITAYMDAETWFTAAEAVEMGFADELQAEKKLSASLKGGILMLNSQEFDISRWKTVPNIVGAGREQVIADTNREKAIAKAKATLTLNKYFTEV